MELVQLRQLVVVAEERVLSHGAEKLNISQPALSRSIRPLAVEQLCMRIPLSDPLSEKKSITFADLAGKEIREYTKTGFWHKVHRDLIPGAVYIEYDDIMVYTNVINSQNPLTFVTELANTHGQNPAGAVTVPITDREATARYRLAFLKEKEASLGDIVRRALDCAGAW